MPTCSRLVNTKKHNIVKTTAEDFTAVTKHTRRHSILEKKHYSLNTISKEQLKTVSHGHMQA